MLGLVLQGRPGKWDTPESQAAAHDCDERCAEAIQACSRATCPPPSHPSLFPQPPACRLASPAPNAAAAPPPKLESELGEIKTLLAELLRSPRSSGEAHSPPPAKGAAGA